MGPPKTARSRRNVYLDRRTVAALREHRQRQREQRIAAGPAWDADHDWVLTDELGGFARPQSMSYEWRKLIERLSHATVGITLDLYSHVVASLARDAAEQIMSSTYDEDFSGSR